jgi:hypothetical protein
MYNKVYDGHMVFYDDKNQLIKFPYTVAWKYVMDLQSSINMHTEEKHTCFITLITGRALHIVGSYRELNEEYINYQQTANL